MITASEDYQAWRCHRCGMLNTRMQFNCGRCRASAPIPPAQPITSRASAAPALTNQEVEKAQQELLRSVREIGHVS